MIRSERLVVLAATLAALGIASGAVVNLQAQGGQQAPPQALNLKRAALTTGMESMVMRYVPEMSYGAPTRPAGSSQ